MRASTFEICDWHKGLGTVVPTQYNHTITDVVRAGDVLDRWSTSDIMFSLGSAIVARSNKRQLIVALLSTEVEYWGATIATCEAIWL